MKKQFVLLVIALLAVSAASCAEAGTQPGGASAGTTAAPAVETVSETEADPYNVADGLPEKDLNGYEFRMYTFDNIEKLYVAEQNGEVINDAVYKANTAVSERFGVKLKTLAQTKNESGMNTLIKTTVLAGEDAFDIAVGHDTMTGTASLEGIFMNLRKLPHLDFDKPWWPASTVESLTINGKYYVGTSALSYLGMHWTKCLYVNKTELESAGTAVPYDEVESGGWLIDRLISLTKDVYRDVDGDSAKSDADFYGYATANGFSGYVDVCGIEAITAGKDGKLKLSLDNQNTVKFIEKLYTWFYESNGVYVNMKNDGQKYKYPVDFFNNGRALFAYDRLGDAVDTFRYGEIDYGILPMPKYTESQEEYKSSYFDRLFIVPITEKNTENVGLVIEAMSAEGYRTVTPAYFEIALKNKFTTDEKSVEMLDIIVANRIMDFSYVYGAGSGLSNIAGSLLSIPSKDFASFYASKSTAALAYVDKLNETYSKLEV